MRIFFGFLILASLGSARLLAAESPELSIKVLGIKSDKGQVVITLYKDDSSWLKKEQAVESQSIAASSKEVLAHFRVKPGTYAVHVFQDENTNGKLDMRWLPPGPAEPWVVSNNAQGTMGPPSYKDAKIDVQSDQTLSLLLQ